MARSATPFALDGGLTPKLESLHRHWRSICRVGAEMPFADDIDMVKIETVTDDLFVLGVLEKPVRFRVELVRLPGWSAAVTDVSNRFLDELVPASPLELARSQADATAELREPTLHVHHGSGEARSYARLMLPFWGEGQVKLIVCGVD